VKEVGKYRDLPLALYHLGFKLRERAPVIMQHSGTLHTLFNELLAALVRNGQLMSIITPQGLQNLFDISYDLRRAVPSLYLSAINTINKSTIRPDKGPLADAVYTNLRSDLPEISPSPSTYGSLLSIHTEQGASSQTYIYYLDEFAKFHGVADKMSYQKVLSALAAQGDIDGVQEVFLRLSQAHGRPTEPAFYTPLLYVYARLGDVSATQREFQTMRDYGVEPTAYAWNILIYAHARSPHPDQALNVLDTMRAEGVTPDVYTFTTLIGVFARNGDTHAVLDILEKAQQHQVKGSYALITGLVQSYCLNDQADAAERLAAAATIATLRGTPTTMWNYLLRHYAFLADSKSMLRVQQRMTALGVDSDAMTHAAFMTALVVLGKTRDAMQILRTLNMSQTLAATSFHYAIILHGFAQEGDRDMANVIYQELVERFPRLGASPRLAMLHLQAGRNPIENERPKFAAQYLEEILHGLSTEDRADRQPQPGLRRRRGIDAVPSLYIEYFVDLLMSKGQVKRAEQLVQRFENLHQSSYLQLNSSASMSIPLLCAHLSVQAGKHAWDRVDAIWRHILERGIQLAKHFGLREEKPSPETKDDNTHAQEGPASPPIQPVGLPDAGLVPSENFTFGSMIPDSASNAFPLDEPGLAILYSQRNLLEVPLSRYLDTLAVRQLQSSAIALVAKMEKVGFALTSKNWNMYIQTLTRSDDPEHWLLAYKLFERKMIAHTPPWPVLQRGKWLPPQASEDIPSVPVRRKTIEKRNPDQLMPTYYTAVHLASVLLKANRLAAEGENSTYLSMWRRAPLTCRYIRRMPYLKDRVQGLLLRDRKMRILPPRRPRLHTTPDRSGVLGSRSPADHVPVTDVVGLEAALTSEATDTKSSTEGTRIRAIRRAEFYEGQISRTQARRHDRRDLEGNAEFERRIECKEQELLQILQRMRKDISLSRTVSDMYIGHPTIPASVNLDRTRNSRQGGQTLYGSGYHRLIKEAQAKRLLRGHRRVVLRRVLRRKIPRKRTVGMDSGRTVPRQNRQHSIFNQTDKARRTTATEAASDEATLEF
jgi:pentatricopeptide repeat-containing protein PET309